jgi:pimeloyl-ACP methyl ester carboxylesterase
MTSIIFIHGLESSGKGFKARFFQNKIPEILTPSFFQFDSNIPIQEILQKRMDELRSFLDQIEKWIIIGSSFGGLMGALYTLKNSNKIIKLILLAPFLNTPFLEPSNFEPINVPVIVYHGKNDQIIPFKQSYEIAKNLFVNLKYNLVDDDHFLHATVKSINWKKLIEF